MLRCAVFGPTRYPKIIAILLDSFLPYLKSSLKFNHISLRYTLRKLLTQVDHSAVNQAVEQFSKCPIAPAAYHAVIVVQVDRLRCHDVVDLLSSLRYYQVDVNLSQLEQWFGILFEQGKRLLLAAVRVEEK